MKDSNDFSFSGLKTALLRLAEAGRIPNNNDAAASFQKAVVDVLVSKTVTVAKEYHVRHVLGPAVCQQMSARLPLTASLSGLDSADRYAPTMPPGRGLRLPFGPAKDGFDLDAYPGLRLA
jgi:N6-L-threonylcarbamoyladenine synthase